MANTKPSASSEGGKSNFSWRNPPPEKQKKHGLVALGDDFQPTPQEQKLLDMYETIKQYEKQAAMMRKDAALRKLQERNADFLQSQSKRKTKRKPKDKSAVKTGGSDEDMDEDMSGEEDEEGAAVSNYEKREAKLAEMRKEIAEAKEKSGSIAKQKEEEMIAEHLKDENAEDDDDLGGIVLKKRRVDDGEKKGSLLMNMQPEQTPQHEFSRKLGLEPSRGKVLFPPVSDSEDDELAQAAGSEKNKVWVPPESAVGPNDDAFLAFLEDFDIEASQHSSTSGNNTLAIKFAAPADSRRFSLNIAQADQSKSDFDSILFHFNPRQRERGGNVVINDKEDEIWGQALSIPLSQLPVIFGKDSCTLLIQIHSEGFDVFLDDQHCARLEHRQDLLSTENSRLCLQFPSTDDYGNPENWSVFKVWWGFKPLIAKGDNLTDVAGVNSFNSIHPRKLFLRGLPKISSSSEVEVRRAELERAFGKYGGSRGVVKVVVYPKKTYATVELETERLAELALQEMSHLYQINRARRTKHEALLEERAAKEQGTSQRRDGGWD